MKKKIGEMPGEKLSYREAELALSPRECGDGKEECVVRCSVSSETPYLREEIWDGSKFVRGYEVLGHGDGEVDCSRIKDGLVIQDTHWGDQIGIMRNPEIKDGKISGEIEFGCGARSQEIKADAEAGIRRNMSVGYRVLAFRKSGVAEDGLPVFRAVRWQPYEASFVNVPADAGVGVGRSEETGDGAESAPTAKKEREGAEMETPIEKPVAAGITAEEVRGIVSEGVESLRAEFAKKPAMPEAKRVEQFDEGDKREIGKRYNIINVIRSMVSAHEGKAGMDIGFEREVSDEISRQSHREAKGFFVPDCVLQKRAFDKGTNAGALVATDTLFGSMIDALVADTVLGRAGVTVLDGLVGDISIPKGGSATSYWVSSEGGDATETTPAVGQILGTPKTCGSYTDVTRKLLLQSGISAQQFVVDAIRGAIGRGIEAAAFKGTGASGQPSGLDTRLAGGSSGINSISMVANAPTKANLVEFWQKIYTANAAGGSMGFIGSPAVKGLLCKTLDLTTITSGDTTVGGVTPGKYLCEGGKVEGYDFFMSNLCTATKLYFGDWSNLVLAFWSGIDLTVDTSSLSKSGGVRVVALQDCDVLLRNGEAFSIGTAISA